MAENGTTKEDEIGRLDLARAAADMGDPKLGGRGGPERKYTIIQVINGELYRTEVVGNHVWVFGHSDTYVTSNTLVSGENQESHKGQIVFAAPSANVVSILEGWGHERLGLPLLATGIGVVE